MTSPNPSQLRPQPDPYGRQEQLAVFDVHQPDCSFGPPGAFWRIHFRTSSEYEQTRYCSTFDDVQRATALLEPVARGTIHVERDACLDGGETAGDARTPDVVDAEQWLAMPKHEAMTAVGITSEAEYRQAYDQIEQAVYRRDNRASQGGARASIVIKKRGAKVTDVG